MSDITDILQAATPSQSYGPYTDGLGRYKLRLPGTPKPRGYTRVTTFIKALDDTEGLIPWKATTVAVGMMLRPGLHARWAALVAEHPNPWYAGDQAKAECKQLVKECSEAGGASDRADVGTGLHGMLHLFNRGLTPTIGPTYAADVEAYLTATSRIGLVADPAWCEQTLWIPEFEVVGTADTFATMGGVPDHVATDLKTGAHIKPLSFAQQLACYAHAEAAITWPRNEGDECVLRPVPKLNQDVGYIVHLPAGSGQCDIYALDLKAGHAALVISQQVRRYRNIKTSDLMSAVIPPTADMLKNPAGGSQHSRPAGQTAGEVYGEGSEASMPTTHAATSPTLTPAATSSSTVDTWTPGDLQYRAWLYDRLKADAAQLPDPTTLPSFWPPDVPPLKGGHVHSASELDLIWKALVQLEANFGLPFVAWYQSAPTASPVPFRGEGEPATTGTVTAQEGSPPSGAYFSGPTLDVPTNRERDALVDRLKRLPPDLLADVTNAAKKMSIPNLDAGQATSEDLAALDGIIMDAEFFLENRLDAINRALASVGDQDAELALRFSTTGSLEEPTQETVDTIVTLAQGVVNGTVMLRYNPDQTVALGCPDSYIAQLQERYGTRGQLIAAVNRMALKLGMRPVRSLRLLAETPRLALAVGAETDPNPQEMPQ